MLWKRGALLKTLKYLVEKDVRDSFYKNEVFLESRWSTFEKIVIWGAKHIVLANVVMAMTVVTFSVVASELYFLIKEITPSLSGLTSIIEVPSEILGVQITILGLIFPLVIAFIGVLLQGRSSNEAMWAIYRHNSGFMLVGFSSLTLSILLVVFKLISPWLSYQLKVSGSVALSAWFIVSLILSGWFLWKTVMFLSLNSRMAMVVRYTINEVIASDVRTRLMNMHWLSAAKKELQLDPPDSNIKIKIFHANELNARVWQIFPEPRTISNIWLIPLMIGLWLWRWQAKFQVNHDEETILCLPSEIYGHAKRKLVFAKTNGPNINPISKFLIRFSMRTSPKHSAPHLNIEQTIGALFGQIEDALKESNSRLFDSAQKSLVMFHKKIESAMAFKNDEGEPDNWLLLSDSAWFGGNILDAFVRESIDVGRKITRRMLDDASYYESWCYFYSRLFEPQNYGIPIRIAIAYIDGHYFIWETLMSWMGGANQTDSMPAQQRDRAIKHYVGSWEHWPRLLIRNLNSPSGFDYSCVSRHLQRTSCMLISATKYNCHGAAQWAIDVLVHWPDLLSVRQISHHCYSWHQELINTKILQLPPDHRLFKATFGTAEYSEKDAVAISIKNYWCDIRCLTAAYLMSAQRYKEGNFYKEYISAILSCKRLEPSGIVDINHDPICDSRDVLGVYLRQNFDWYDGDSYESLLETHLETLARLEKPEWVSGRIYSSYGTKRELYLPVFFKVMCVGLTNQSFDIDSKWAEFLKSDLISQGQLEGIIERLKRLTLLDDAVMALVCHQFDVDEKVAKVRAEYFVASINAIVLDFQEKVASNLKVTPIDYNRLTEFGILASSSNFILYDGPFPVYLFQDIEYEDDFKGELTLTNITGYRRCEVSQGIEVSRPVNEGEWLSGIIEQRVPHAIFQQLLKELDWVDVKTDSSLGLMRKAISDSQIICEHGFRPVLFVGAWEVINTINAAVWKYDVDKELLPFDIFVESGLGDAYICHIAGVAVYRLPFDRSDFSILISLETFHKVHVKRFGDGRYVNVSFKADDAELTGTLSLAFGIKCDFKPTHCIRYLSPNGD